MTPLSNSPCLIAPDFGLIGGRRARRISCLAAGSLGLVVGMLLAATSAFAYSQPPSFLGTLAVEEKKSFCEENGTVMSCVCDSEKIEKELEATLSGEVPELQVTCKGRVKFKPEPSKTALVCPADTPDLSKVATTRDSDGKACFELAALLSGDVSKVAWEQEPETQKMVLHIPKDVFPHAKKKFMVGCAETTDSQCKMTVTLKAKATETKGQTVTCAYGFDSNKTTQNIMLTPEQRLFTLVCGADGEALPLEYAKTYCPVVNTTNEAQEKCDGKYPSILPSYEEGWWKTGDGNSVSLEVPDGDFPEKEARILVGCRLKNSKGPVLVKSTASPQEPSVCTVEVTIEGGLAPCVAETPSDEAASSAAARSAEPADRALPWVEKFRPERLDEVLSHDDIIRTIRHYVERGQLPHLLFHGPPGTGKTSTILAVAKEFYGSAVRTHVLELNASDDRGINTVREQIKTFAETSSTSFKQGRLAFGKPAEKDEAAGGAPNREKKDAGGSGATPTLKLIILDEADQMTNAAQNALRRIMEAYARNVRFCLICNFINKITPAIQSRCTGFRFMPLASPALRQKAADIAEAEGMKLSDDGLSALMRIAQGDMRRLLNCMQASHLAHPGETISADIVHRTLGLPLPLEVDAMFERLLVADFFTCCKDLDELVGTKGYAMRDWILAFHEKVLRIDWPVNILITFIGRLADLEERLAAGASETVQMHAVVASFFEARAGLQAAAAATPPVASQ
ncbi:hypothetical protein BESB_047150 [Besnoitia besnoiti]|uniref:AAA+ ATPase domain-containing protein n=1 Tax=Besnoitia besnoiti TaxID=94643 RepID=A0A2A9MLF7_BESBE|nr:hypothetical protein BESB_047150 [Besnoitia besnoiti]PFH36523.1 hypothetical protein BESB_047150 [Besnoitia besnoiti]